MIFSEEAVSVKNKPIINTFEFQEEISRVLPSGEELKFTIQETPVKISFVEEVFDLNFLEEKTEITMAVGIKGDKGDKGDTGEPGSSTEITSTAGSVLGGNRVVVIENDIATYANSTTLSHRHKIAGITTHSAIQGAEIIIQTSGEMTEPSWNWESEKPIFVGGNGYLTQIVPSSGFQFEIAFPLSPTKIFIEKKIPIIK